MNLVKKKSKKKSEAQLRTEFLMRKSWREALVRDAIVDQPAPSSVQLGWLFRIGRYATKAIREEGGDLLYFREECSSL